MPSTRLNAPHHLFALLDSQVRQVATASEKRAVTLHTLPNGVDADTLVLGWGDASWRSARERWGPRRAFSRAHAAAVAASVLLALALATMFTASDPWHFTSATTRVLWAGLCLMMAMAITWMGLRHVRHESGRPPLSLTATAIFCVIVLIMLVPTISLHLWIDATEPKFPAPSMEVSRDGHVLAVNGSIHDGFTLMLDDVLRKNPSLQAIHIDSSGGLVQEALSAGRHIRDLKLTVHVGRECASACVPFWALAQHRTIAATAKIGLHQTWMPESMPQRMATASKAESDASVVRIMRRAGFSDTLIAARDSTPPAQMYWVPAPELGGVASAVTDEAGEPLSPAAAKLLYLGSLLTDMRVLDALVLLARAQPEHITEHADTLYASVRAQDHDAIRLSMAESAKAAKLYGLAHAPDTAVQRWAHTIRDAAHTAVINVDGPRCAALLGVAVENAPEDVASTIGMALHGLVRAAVATSPSRPQPRLSSWTQQDLMKRMENAMISALRPGQALDPAAWPPLENCRITVAVLDSALALPIREAAESVRLLEGS